MTLANGPSLETRERTILVDALHLCQMSDGPSRILDMDIAFAIFPGLRDLPLIHVGVWQHPDGSRVRALRYSSSEAAASTLVPSGYWVLSSGPGMVVMGPAGEWESDNQVRAIALCVAALQARIAETRGALTPQNQSESHLTGQADEGSDRLT